MSNLSELLPSGGGQNEVDFVASGTLPNGQAVILNSNGTVTAVAETSTTTPESIPTGSKTAFNSADTNFAVSACDPTNNNKFVTAYMDITNSNYGTAIVGTVSGTSISFGTEYVFESAASSSIAIAFDPINSGKFVVAYKLTNGHAKVGTVSGTTISFGAQATFNAASTLSTAIAFDPINSGKCVVAYKDGGNSNQGTACVGTVSGTSISFGTESVFNAASTGFNSVAFDPNTSGKCIIAYQNTGSGDKGTSSVGTVSGTSISFGTAVIFNASGGALDISVSYDPNIANKFIIAFTDIGNSSYGTVVIGTVSGTSVTYGSEYVFNTSHTTLSWVSFDNFNANTFVIAYRNGQYDGDGVAVIGTVSGSSISYGSKSVWSSEFSSKNITLSFNANKTGQFVIAYIEILVEDQHPWYGVAILGQIATTVTATNLTSTNLLGISAESITSGATGVINTWGGLNEGQSSLTPASIYYVQSNGTISTVSTSPAQKIGQAISATTLNILDL